MRAADGNFDCVSVGREYLAAINDRLRSANVREIEVEVLRRSSIVVRA